MKALFLKLMGVLFLISVAIGFNNTSFAINPPSSSVTEMTYDQAMAQNKPVVLKFYADWCGACKRVGPILESIKPDYTSKFNFVYLNVDSPGNSALSSKYGITSLPSIVIVDPKTGKFKFINQDTYFDPTTLRQQFDDYLKTYPGSCTMPIS